MVAELCSLIFVENMKKQRQEVRNSAKLKWWSGMDEKVAVIKIWSWNPQFLLELKNSFFLGSKNDKTMLTREQITLRGNEMARQSNEDHWHFFFCIRYVKCYPTFNHVTVIFFKITSSSTTITPSSNQITPSSNVITSSSTFLPPDLLFYPQIYFFTPRSN